jgi:multidrug efflux system membrane fusion protein
MTVRSPVNRLKKMGVSRMALLLTSAGLLLSAGAAWWWTHPKSGETASASAEVAPGNGQNGRRFGGGNRVQPVSVAVVNQQDMRVVLAAIGNIAASNTATVRARVEGELKAIHFTEGQQVRAGALLAEIDPRNYEIQLAQTQGQLARDTAQLRNAKLDLDRYKDLLAKDSIARQQVESQDALVRQLAGTVQSDQAQVDSAKLSLSYTKIVAPISGRLGLKQVDLGNVVRANDAVGLVNITQTQPISVVFGVPEGNLPQISSKLKAGQPLVVEAWDRDQKIKLATGRVRSTDNAIDLATGTIKLKAEFANADNALFPNQFVNIRLQVDAIKDSLVVPSSAIQRGAQGILVYVVKADSTVTVRRVRVGITEADLTSIQGEVSAGEQVVTDGADRLREGAKVDVITATTRDRGADKTSTRERAAAAPGASAPAISASDDTGKKRRDTNNTPSAAPPPGNARPVRPTNADTPATDRGADRRSGNAGEGGDRPRWMDRLPPELVEKVKAMSPEDRRAFLQKMREQRRAEGQ